MVGIINYISLRPSGQIYKGSACLIKVTEFLARSFCAPYGDLAVMKEEIWKWVVGYEGFYKVSNHGNIKGFMCLFGKRKIPRILKIFFTKSGYKRICLCKGGIKKQERIHRLVLSAFIGPRPEGMEGCHIDGDKANNQLDNLKWDTHLNNMRDKQTHGTQTNGEDMWMSKLNGKKIEDILYMRKKGIILKDIANKYNVSISNISNITTGKIWKNITKTSIKGK